MYRQRWVSIRLRLSSSGREGKRCRVSTISLFYPSYLIPRSTKFSSKQSKSITLFHISGSSNGRICDSDSHDGGSNPSPEANVDRAVIGYRPGCVSVECGFESRLSAQWFCSSAVEQRTFNPWVESSILSKITMVPSNNGQFTALSRRQYGFKSHWHHQ